MRLSLFASRLSVHVSEWREEQPVGDMHKCFRWTRSTSILQGIFMPSLLPITWFLLYSTIIFIRIRQRALDWKKFFGGECLTWTTVRCAASLSASDLNRTGLPKSPVSILLLLQRLWQFFAFPKMWVICVAVLKISCWASRMTTNLLLWKIWEWQEPSPCCWKMLSILI